MKKVLLGITTSMALAASASAEIISIKVEDHTPNGAYREAGGGVRIYLTVGDAAMKNFTVGGPNYVSRDHDFGEIRNFGNIIDDKSNGIIILVKSANAKVVRNSDIGTISLERDLPKPVDQQVLVTITEFDPATKTVKGTVQKM